MLPSATTRLAVLGVTGSIGRQALDVAGRHPDRLRITALAAGSNLDALAEVARGWQPKAVALEHAADPTHARAVLRDAAPDADVRVGAGACAWLAGEPCADVVLNAIVGAAGLGASLAALERGARLALANKESLVVGGTLVRAALARGGALLPVDSEHSAALQCLGGRPPHEVARLTLTASGGALRNHPDWRRATRTEVLAHPVWAMGTRITVDSALLVNKGFELIEAEHLFALDWDQLEAVLHPQTVLHAIVGFRDGSSVVQAAAPDMRVPIQLALSWPERWELVPPLPATALAGLELTPIAPGRFPAFDIVCAAGQEGGTAPCVVNAADEVAVQAFLDGALPLGDVPEVLARVRDAHPAEPVVSLEQLRACDARARDTARAAIAAGVGR